MRRTPRHDHDGSSGPPVWQWTLRAEPVWRLSRQERYGLRASRWGASRWGASRWSGWER